MMRIRNQLQPPPTLPPRSWDNHVRAKDPFQVVSELCKTAIGNSELLYEALINSEGPDDLRGGLVKEFLSKCYRSRESIQDRARWFVEQFNTNNNINASYNTPAVKAALNELRVTQNNLDAILRFYGELEHAGNDRAEQERVKNYHTIRRVTSETASDTDSRPGPSQTRPSSSSFNEAEIQRLFEIAKSGRAHAELLSEALEHAQPGELNSPLIEEFCTACRDAQKELLKHIQWADNAAAQSRRETRDADAANTMEEILLRGLLATDEALTKALRMYDDLQHSGVSSFSQRLGKQPANGDIDPSELVSICQAGRMNAELLRDALANAQRSDLEGELIKEFTTNCRASQEQVVTRIPWATAKVEQSGEGGTSSEEQILQDLLGTNEALIEVLSIHDDMQQGGSFPDPNSLVIKKDLPLPPSPGPVSPQNDLNGTSSQLSMAGVPPFTNEDRTKFAKIFFASGPKNGVLSGPQARDLLMKSKLPPATLARIWDLADVTCRGALDVDDFGIAMYLVQACMTGQLAQLPDALPSELYRVVGKIAPPSMSRHGSDEPVAGPSRVNVNIAEPVPVSTSASAGYFDIPPAAKSHADRIFAMLDPQSTGQVQGYAVASFMLRRNVPMKVSEQIWDMVDVGQKGWLSRDEFAAAMNLVDMHKAGKALPQSLPARTPIPQAGPSSSSTPRPLTPREEQPSLIDFNNDSLRPPSTPRTPSATGSRMGSRATSPAGHLLDVPNSATGFGTQPQPTSSPFNLSESQSPPASPPGAGPSASPRSDQAWDVNPVAKARYDGFFDTLDPWRKGYIDGEAAVSFFGKSRLPDAVLAHIWDLADMNHNGQLSCDEFAVAMHLIVNKLKGRELPTTVPLSLVPPSLRRPAEPRSPTLPPPPLPIRRASLAVNTAPDLPAPAPAPAPAIPPQSSVFPQNIGSTANAPPSFTEIEREETPPPSYEEAMQEEVEQSSRRSRRRRR